MDFYDFSYIIIQVIIIDVKDRLIYCFRKFENIIS
jgi:hypothetical protein